MVSVADIVVYERLVARVALSIGALSSLWAAFILARTPLSAAKRAEARKGDIAIILEDFSPSVVFLIIAGGLFWFSAQPINLGEVLSTLRNPTGTGASYYDTRVSTAAPSQPSPDTTLAAFAALGAASRAIDAAASQMDVPRAALLKTENEAVTSAMADLARQVYGPKVAAAYEQHQSASGSAAPCADVDISPALCANLENLFKLAGKRP